MDINWDIRQHPSWVNMRQQSESTVWYKNTRHVSIFSAMNEQSDIQCSYGNIRLTNATIQQLQSAIPESCILNILKLQKLFPP